MTEDLLSQLANPKKFAFVEDKKEEKTVEKPQVQSVLPTEPIQNVLPKQSIEEEESVQETKPVEIKRNNGYDRQLEDRKKVEDIFRRLINNDRRKK